MPNKPQRPCRYPGCPGFCVQGQVFCRDHMAWSGDRLRGGADARGYDARWRTARKRYLSRHPLCIECLKKGDITPATVVDHIVPHRGDRNLFWDESNWQSLCERHHNQKTGKGM